MSEKIDYLELKKFYLFFADNFLDVHNLPDEIKPATMLAKYEKSAPAIAKKGLDAAINDVIEMTWSWSAEKQLKFNADLKNNDIISLVKVKIYHSKKIASIMARGLIKSDSEYDVVRSIVEGGGDGLPFLIEKKLRDMITVYEKILKKDM